MSFATVMLCYGAAILLALVLLYFFRAHWVLHLLSVVLAFAVGLYPPPEALQTPLGDVIIGCLFLFLLFWGVGAIFVKRSGARKPAHSAS